jgi:hypothetical protein
MFNSFDFYIIHVEGRQIKGNDQAQGKKIPF